MGGGKGPLVCLEKSTQDRVAGVIYRDRLMFLVLRCHGPESCNRGPLDRPQDQNSRKGPETVLGEQGTRGWLQVGSLCAPPPCSTTLQADIRADVWGQKLRSGSQNPRTHKHSDADIHDPKARTSMIQGGSEKLQPEKFLSNFSFPLSGEY